VALPPASLFPRSRSSHQNLIVRKIAVKWLCAYRLRPLEAIPSHTSPNELYWDVSVETPGDSRLHVARTYGCLAGKFQDAGT
jgi:hypothetical protein